MKEQTIISAILYKYIDEYLLEISNSKIDMNYYGDDWRIEVIIKEPRRMGKLEFPVNHVTFYADEDKCDELLKNFRMKFMSAGA